LDWGLNLSEDWKPWNFRGGGTAKEVPELLGKRIKKGLLDYTIKEALRRSSSDEQYAIIVAIIPMQEEGEWLPMKEGEVNCFVSEVRRDIQKTVKKNGKKVRQRSSIQKKHDKKILDEFEGLHLASGVQPSDVWSLEDKLKVRFRFWDQAGTIIETSGNTEHNYKTLDYVRHNGHCIGKGRVPIFPPASERTVKVIDDDQFYPQLIKPTQGSSPAALDYDEIDRILNDLHSPHLSCEKGDIPPAERITGDTRTRQGLWSLLRHSDFENPGVYAWVIGEECVTSTGHLVRSARMQKTLEDAEAYEREDDDYDEMADFMDASRTVGGAQA